MWILNFSSESIITPGFLTWSLGLSERHEVTDDTLPLCLCTLFISLFISLSWFYSYVLLCCSSKYFMNSQCFLWGSPPHWERCVAWGSPCGCPVEVRHYALPLCNLHCPLVVMGVSRSHFGWLLGWCFLHLVDLYLAIRNCISIVCLCSGWICDCMTISILEMLGK